MYNRVTDVHHTVLASALLSTDIQAYPSFQPETVTEMVISYGPWESNFKINNSVLSFIQIVA